MTTTKVACTISSAVSGVGAHLNCSRINLAVDLTRVDRDGRLWDARPSVPSYGPAWC